jgi:hypothetical protein
MEYFFVSNTTTEVIVICTVNWKGGEENGYDLCEGTSLEFVWKD